MVAEATLPEEALLQRYATPPSYTDCFTTTVPSNVALPRFVEAFYTSPLFRCERIVLGAFAGRPSTDNGAKAVAEGRTDQFAAWDVEERTETQLLMCDMAAATRSWFMVRPAANTTELFFGSAVTPKEGKELGRVVRAFMPVHVLYSKLLLSGARKRLLSLDISKRASA